MQFLCLIWTEKHGSERSNTVNHFYLTPGAPPIPIGYLPHGWNKTTQMVCRRATVTAEKFSAIFTHTAVITVRIIAGITCDFILLQKKKTCMFCTVNNPYMKLVSTISSFLWISLSAALLSGHCKLLQLSNCVTTAHFTYAIGDNTAIKVNSSK